MEMVLIHCTNETAAPNVLNKVESAICGRQDTLAGFSVLAVSGFREGTCGFLFEFGRGACIGLNVVNPEFLDLLF